MTRRSIHDLSQSVLNDELVEGYLRENPDYFLRHPQLLASLCLKHDSGKAISLIERQVAVLRQKNRGLERKLVEIVQIARDNEGLSACLHRLALALFHVQNIDDVLVLTKRQLHCEFPSTEIALHLLGKAKTGSERSAKDSGEQRVQTFDEFFEPGRPTCGIFNERQKRVLFGDRSDKVYSAAIIPLTDRRRFGILALGSAEEGRFGQRMDTQFLDYLGELVSRALRNFYQ